MKLEDIVKGDSAARKNKSTTCSKCKNLGHNAKVINVKMHVQVQVHAQCKWKNTKGKGNHLELGRKGTMFFWIELV